MHDSTNCGCFRRKRQAFERAQEEQVIVGTTDLGKVKTQTDSKDVDCVAEEVERSAEKAEHVEH